MKSIVKLDGGVDTFKGIKIIHGGNEVSDNELEILRSFNGFKVKEKANIFVISNIKEDKVMRTEVEEIEDVKEDDPIKVKTGLFSKKKKKK